jgi:serine/threonine-protein kinase
MTGVPYEPLRDSVPHQVRAIIDRALARDPNDRFATADEMRHALEQAMASLGRITTTDDVANVLHYFSQERTQRRKDAIEAAARTAQALERERSVRGRTGHTDPPPMMAPPPVTSPMGVGAVQSTHVMMPVNGAIEGPVTRPSMRTMQGASMSEAPFAERVGISQTHIFGGLIVFSLVAMLGVAGSFLISHRDEPGAGTASTVAPPVTTAAPTAPTVAIPTVVPTVLVAPVVTATQAAPSTTDAVTPPAPSPIETAAKPVPPPGPRNGGTRKTVVDKPPVRPPPAPAPKPTSDPYGF